MIGHLDDDDDYDNNDYDDNGDADAWSSVQSDLAV